MNKSTLFALLVGAVALTFAAGAYAEGYVDADGDGINDNAAFMHRGRGFFGHWGGELRGLIANLTEEQKAELKTTIDNLKAEGATPDQIHVAVGEKLQSYGVTLPEDWNTPPELRGLLRGLAADLTDEQKAELEQAVTDLRAQGATPDQIHVAVGEKLESFGVTLPARWDMPPRPPRGFGDNHRLSPEQQTEVQTLVEAMKAEGKTAQEMRDAVAAKYQEWGKAMPGRPVRR